MKSRLQNQLNMVGTCITFANDTEQKPAWSGQEPAAFGEDLVTLTTNYGKISAAHTLAMAATGGAGDEKSLAESALESSAHTLARACANYFRKTGDADRRGKVDFTKTDIARLRDRDLADRTKAIRDIAQAATAQPGAAARGVTPARIAALSAIIATFEALLTKPRGQIVSRSTLLKEVETDTAALLEDLRDLDDLVLQFGGSEAGDRFIQAWKAARIIVDAGGGHAEDEEEKEEEVIPPAPPAPPAP